MSQYAKRMAFLSARIFGEVTRPTNSRSQYIVRRLKEKPLNLRPEIVEYYPKLPELSLLFNRLRFHGLYRDEHRDFRENMIRQKALRGKVKPKKGEGKKALAREG